jgi:hypothetical protein
MQIAIYSQTLMDLAPFVLQFMDNQNVSWTLQKIHNDIVITTLFTKLHVYPFHKTPMCTCAKVVFHILPKKKVMKVISILSLLVNQQIHAISTLSTTYY